MSGQDLDIDERIASYSRVKIIAAAKFDFFYNQPVGVSTKKFDFFKKSFITHREALEIYKSKIKREEKKKEVLKVTFWAILFIIPFLLAIFTNVFSSSILFGWIPSELQLFIIVILWMASMAIFSPLKEES